MVVHAPPETPPEIWNRHAFISSLQTADGAGTHKVTYPNHQQHLHSHHQHQHHFVIIYRKAFDPEAQFAALCRIVTDPTQTLNNKVKLAFLEYLLELIPLLDPSDFKDSQGNEDDDVIVVMMYVCYPEIRQAVAKVVKFTGEPKSAEIRKLSQKSIVALFDLSPATFSLILRTLPKGDQDSANRILNAYISELPSSGDESDREISSTPRTKKATPTTKVGIIIISS